jgi:hypothetical protein
VYFLTNGYRKKTITFGESCRYVLRQIQRHGFLDHTWKEYKSVQKQHKNKVRKCIINTLKTVSISHSKYRNQSVRVSHKYQLYSVWFDPMIYHARGDHINHLTTDRRRFSNHQVFKTWLKWCVELTLISTILHHLNIFAFIYIHQISWLVCFRNNKAHHCVYTCSYIEYDVIMIVHVTLPWYVLNMLLNS